MSLLSCINVKNRVHIGSIKFVYHIIDNEYIIDVFVYVGVCC